MVNKCFFYSKFYYLCPMIHALETIGNIPATTSVIGSFYPQIKDKNKKVSELEKSGDIIRLKRGLYVVSPEVSRKALSTELIANHLYAPSYVSLQSALRYYGLIPEAVYTMRSMTIKHSRTFENGLGRFDYISTPVEVFSIGITQVVTDDYAFLIATPEKALCDLIASTAFLNLRYLSETETYLSEYLRLDMDAFRQMRTSVFSAYAAVGKKSRTINNLIKLLER